MFEPSEHTPRTGRPSTPFGNKVFFLVWKKQKASTFGRPKLRTLPTPKLRLEDTPWHVATHLCCLLRSRAAPVLGRTSSGAVLTDQHEIDGRSHWCTAEDCLPHANPTFDMHRRHRSRFKRAQQPYLCFQLTYSTATCQLNTSRRSSPVNIAAALSTWMKLHWIHWCFH